MPWDSRWEEDPMSLIDAEMSRLKGEIRVLTRERSAAKEQALLFVADDLRRAAEAHLKSAAIEGRRLYRKHLTETAHVLLERAEHYEKMSQETA
jgi:hypothetical protein